jgi:hypothetical protein
MTTGAHVRPEPLGALPRLRGGVRQRAEDQIEESAISRAYDALVDAGFQVPHHVVAQILRQYVADVRAHGGKL